MRSATLRYLSESDERYYKRFTKKRLRTREVFKEIEYVKFNILPSEQDEALVRKLSDWYVQEFKNTKIDFFILLNE